MGWTLRLDREREWPAGRKVSEIALRDPTLRDMRSLPEIEKAETLPGGVSRYGIDWDALARWLQHLVADDVDRGLVEMLSPAEAERAKTALIGFFAPAAAATPSRTPPTTSASEPDSDRIRIE